MLRINVFYRCTWFVFLFANHFLAHWVGLLLLLHVLLKTQETDQAGNIMPTSQRRRQRPRRVQSGVQQPFSSHQGGWYRPHLHLRKPKLRLAPRRTHLQHWESGSALTGHHQPKSATEKLPHPRRGSLQAGGN